MTYSNSWQDNYDNLLPEDFEIPDDKTEDEDYTEEYEDEQDC